MPKKVSFIHNEGLIAKEKLMEITKEKSLIKLKNFK